MGVFVLSAGFEMDLKASSEFNWNGIAFKSLSDPAHLFQIAIASSYTMIQRHWSLSAKGFQMIRTKIDREATEAVPCASNLHRIRM